MKNKSAIAVIVIGQFAVGSAALFARAGLDAGMAATSLAAWRLTLASLMVLAYVFIRQKGKTQKAPQGYIRLLIAGVFLGLHFATWFESLNHISIAISTLLVATVPIWAAFLEIAFHKKPPNRAFWLGLLLAMSGLAAVSFQAAPLAKGSVWLGCLWAVLGALAFAVYLLIVQPFQTSIGTARTIAWTYSSAAASMWIFAFAIDWPNVVPANSMSWTSALGMAILAQGVGHTSLNWSLKHMSPSIVGVTTLLEPVFAAALAWPIFGEPISMVQAFGAMMLLAGVGVVLTKGNSNQVRE